LNIKYKQFMFNCKNAKHWILGFYHKLTLNSVLQITWLTRSSPTSAN
jgi:hypothetical protein